MEADVIVFTLGPDYWHPTRLCWDADAPDVVVEVELAPYTDAYVRRAEKALREKGRG